MDESTLRALNAINRRFYETTADDFDATRQQPWSGWQRLFPYLERHSPQTGTLAVLDVGCGNGRFGVFLAQHFGVETLRYTGIDSSPALLERARLALEPVCPRLALYDLVEPSPGALPLAEQYGQFDLVALFGVLHHIPGAENRLALLRQLASCVAPGGLLVFTEWRFMDVPHLRQRIIPWDAGLQVEAGDYLLDWRRGERALRYCHHVEDAEHQRLLAASGLDVLAEFHADAANRYTLLRKPAL